MSKAKLSREAVAGLTVTVISVLIIAAVVLTLFLEMRVVEGKYTEPAFQNTLEILCPETCSEIQIRLAMEQDAQVLRTDRVRTTMMSRLMIFMVAEIVALLLVALGGVLIFNRIEDSSGHSELSIENLNLKFSFPGLALATLGAVLTGFSLWSAGTSSLLVEVYDFPIYTADPNPFRGRWSGQAPFSPPKEIAMPRPEITVGPPE